MKRKFLSLILTLAMLCALAPQALAVSLPVTDGNALTVSDASADKDGVTVTAALTSSEEMQGVVIAAFYDESGALSAAKFYDAAESVTISGSDEYKTLRLFWWYTLSTMFPMADPVSLDLESVINPSESEQPDEPSDETTAPSATEETTSEPAATTEATATPAATAETTAAPTDEATAAPAATTEATAAPTDEATAAPAATSEATETPTTSPTDAPAVLPTQVPTSEPTATAEATAEPTSEPTATAEATSAPAVLPTQAPTAEPTEEATAVPTDEATATPTATTEATPAPTEAPAVLPTQAPTATPTTAPTATPTTAPTATPTTAPTPTPVPTPTPTPTPLPDTYTTLYSQTYESATAADWTTNTTGRYTPALKTDGSNTWLGVDMTTRNNNGTTLTSPNYSSYVSGLTEYALEFDAALGYTNGTGAPTFSVNTSDGTLFTLTANSATQWAINNYTDTITFATSGFTNDTSSADADSTSTWYHYIIIYRDGLTHLKVLDSSGNTVLGPIVLRTLSSTGALTTMTYATNRYYANFEIDNILIRTLYIEDEFGEKSNETLIAAEFTSGLNTRISQPKSSVHYPITVKATGVYGTDLTDADGLTIEWSTVGISGEDGYISLTKEAGTGAGTEGDAPESTDSTAYFNVRNGVSNYFGCVKATVSYLDETIEISTPFAVLGATDSGTNIAPAAGYPESMSDYAADLVGYTAETSDNLSYQNLVLNNWAIYGSNGSKTLTLDQDEDGTKYLRFASNGGSGSTVGIYQLAEQSSQYIVDMTVRFTGTSMTFGHYYNTPNNTGNNPNWTASYSGGTLTVGTQTITGLNSTDWFRIVVSADESAGTYWVKVYDADGTQVGTADDVELESTYTSTQKYFCFYGEGTYPVDLASFRIYYPTLSSMSVNADSTVQVPAAGENDTTAEISAVLTDIDGYPMSGAVSWSLEDDYAGVTLTDGDDGQTATLTVTNEAGSGTITVLASYGSSTASADITLSTSGNSVAFTSSSSSITIPFSGEDDVTQTYAAELRDKDGSAIADAGAITYSMVDSSGTATSVTGVTFDKETGVLTVTSSAAAKTVYIKAETEYGGETLTSKIKVNIHGLSFAFGSTAPTDESYTQVTASSLYTDKLGYGFASTSDLTDAASSVSGSADYTFKAAVPNGNYTVTVSTTSATMTSEVVESVTATTGISKSGSSFNVAVCDEVLDLTFLADSSVSSISIAQTAAKTANSTPALYAIGDSTTSNNANGALSWGNCVANSLVTIPSAISSFSNNGMAGRDSVNYYNQGRVETVLLNICPGDYVTVNMGINSVATGESSAYYTLLSEYYVQGIIQRGGIPIIVTATPLGYNSDASKGWTENSDGTITCNRGTGARNGVLRQIAQEKDLNIIELGYYFEDYFNDILLNDADFYEEYNAENDTTYTSNIEVLRSWYVDHNHYTSALGTKIADYLLESVAAIIGGSNDFNQANDTHINEQ